MDAQQALAEESGSRVNPRSDAAELRHLIEHTRQEFFTTIHTRDASLYLALYRSLEGLDEALKHPDIFDRIARGKEAHGRDTAARYLDLITRDDKGQSILSMDRRSQYACAAMWMLTPALSGVDLEKLDNSDAVIAKARSLGGIDGGTKDGEADPDRPGIAHLYRQHRDGDRHRDSKTATPPATATATATATAPKFIARIGAHRIDVNSLGEAARQQIIDALAGSDIEIPEFVPSETSKSSETSERRAPRGPNDTVFTTNPRLPAALIKHVSQYVVEGGEWLDPFRGRGAFYDAMPEPRDYCEIAEGRDFFDWKKPVACIASNPAWSDSEPNSYSRLARHAFKIAGVVLLVTKATVTCTYARWADWEAAGHGLREIIHLRWEDAVFEFGDGTKKAPEGLILAAHIWVRGYTGDPHINRTWLQGIPGPAVAAGVGDPGDDSAGEDQPAPGKELAVAAGEDQPSAGEEPAPSDTTDCYMWCYQYPEGWSYGFSADAEDALRDMLDHAKAAGREHLELPSSLDEMTETDDHKGDPEWSLTSDSFCDISLQNNIAVSDIGTFEDTLDQRYLAVQQGWLQEGQDSPYHWWCRNKNDKVAQGYTWTSEQGIHEIWSRLYPRRKFDPGRVKKTLNKDEYPWGICSLDEWQSESNYAEVWEAARKALAPDTDTDTDTT